MLNAIALMMSATTIQHGPVPIDWVSTPDRPRAETRCGRATEMPHRRIMRELMLGGNHSTGSAPGTIVPDRRPCSEYGTRVLPFPNLKIISDHEAGSIWWRGSMPRYDAIRTHVLAADALEA